MSGLPHATEIACLVHIGSSCGPGRGLDWFGVGIGSHWEQSKSHGPPSKSRYSQILFESADVSLR